MDKSNIVITFSGRGSSKPFTCLASNKLFSFDFLEKTQSIPEHIYGSDGNKKSNITDWGLEQFVTHYKSASHAEPALPAGRLVSAFKSNNKKIPKQVRDDSTKEITKEDIFHYVYGVLHNPAYRKKYELNLKREFPRIPFYKDFWQWAKWGKQLMDLHINYEEAKSFQLKRIDEKPKEKKEKQKEFFPKVKEPEPMFGIQPKIKVKLKADKTGR